MGGIVGPTDKHSSRRVLEVVLDHLDEISRKLDCLKRRHAGASAGTDPSATGLRRRAGDMISRIEQTPAAAMLADQMLMAGETYLTITKRLNEIPGFSTSKSAVARYYRRWSQMQGSEK